MKTKSQKLLTSLLALGLTSSAGLYAQNSSTIPAENGIPFNFGAFGDDFIPGINFYSPTQEDLDGDLNFDQGEDLDNDGNFDSVNEDTNGNGVLDLGEDLDGDNRLDLGTEDLDADGFFDRNEDLDGDGNFDIVNEDADGDGNLDNVNEDTNGNGVLDLGEDLDGDNRLDLGNEDLDNDGNLDLGIEDIDGDNNFDNFDEDFNADGAFTRHEDLDGDGNFDNVDEDADGDGNFDTTNEDTNGNGVLDLGEDLDGDGNLDLGTEDIDNDGRFDRGLEDANGNGVFDNSLNRTYLEAVNPITGARQDLDILVENGLFVNGEMVATENYVDAADARLQGQIDQNRSAIRKNKEDIETNTRGIAMVAALQHTTVLPGMTNAFDLSAAHFEGETGIALNYARRINDNVQINFGAASTTDFEESVIKAGIGVQW